MLFSKGLWEELNSFAPYTFLPPSPPKAAYLLSLSVERSLVRECWKLLLQQKMTHFTYSFVSAVRVRSLLTCPGQTGGTGSPSTPWLWLSMSPGQEPNLLESAFKREQKKSCCFTPHDVSLTALPPFQGFLHRGIPAVGNESQCLQLTALGTAWRNTCLEHCRDLHGLKVHLALTWWLGISISQM